MIVDNACAQEGGKFLQSNTVGEMWGHMLWLIKLDPSFQNQGHFLNELNVQDPFPCPLFRLAESLLVHSAD